MAIKILRNGKIMVPGAKNPETGDIVIDGVRIARVVSENSRPLSESELAAAAEVVDLDGALVMPGAIDTHVHFREPGLTAKGDFASESRAAAAGGVTSVIDMPNTRPATTTPEAWRDKMERAAGSMVVNYAFFPGLTADNLGSLVDGIPSEHLLGFKLFMGATTGDMAVTGDDTLDRLFEEVSHTGLPLVVHAEENRLLHLDGPDEPIEEHPANRPADACVAASMQAISLAMRHKTRLHLAHISTYPEAGILEVLHSAHLADFVTSETCPQYLLYDSSQYSRQGARIKCNPSIKHHTDRTALLEACAKGVIDTIATDHAPHLLSDKAGGAMRAASGMPGVQFSLPLMLSILSPDRVMRLMAENPASIFNIRDRGAIKQGYFADLAVLRKRPHTITDAEVVSKCGWTPYNGFPAQWVVEQTWINGERFKPDTTPHGMPLETKPSE